MLRVLIRDASVTRRGYGTSGGYYKGDQAMSSGKRNTRVVTISSGPMASDVEMAKQINDDDSDKGILDNNHRDAVKMGRIVQTSDFELKYDTRRDVDNGGQR